MPTLYEVNISLLIQYSRVCGSYHEFLERRLLLTRKLLNQWFQLVILKSSFRKLYGRLRDLVNRYGILFVSQMITDIIQLSTALPGPFFIRDFSPGLLLD